MRKTHNAGAKKLRKIKKVLDRKARTCYSKNPPSREACGNAPCELNNVSEKAPKVKRALFEQRTATH